MKWLSLVVSSSTAILQFVILFALWRKGRFDLQLHALHMRRMDVLSKRIELLEEAKQEER
jgi:hypothetical protein